LNKNTSSILKCTTIYSREVDNGLGIQRLWYN